MRYEIRDIHPPENVVASMHQQVSAERRKRAEILESEGQRQSAINVAEGSKQAAILESEAVRTRQINHATGISFFNSTGEAEAILVKAQASAKSISIVAEAIKQGGINGKDAVSLSVAEKYVSAFSSLAKESTTMIVPSNVADAAGMVGGMMKVFDGIKNSSAAK